MAEYKTEYVSGDNYEILRQGSIVSGGSYCILDGGPRLILTVPRDVGKDGVEKILEGIYANHQWGIYYLKRTKRWCVPISDRDEDKLEGCAKRL
jgi:hypothetical protein|tara:strand:+ start:357 stop:638 length:282 start_codon:yes stop_codon:yes gene_type:complete